MIEISLQIHPELLLQKKSCAANLLATTYQGISHQSLTKVTDEYWSSGLAGDSVHL
jgi:hypothetical protein